MMWCAWLGPVVLLVGCAGPPLTLYTLEPDGSALGGAGDQPVLGATPTVIAVAPVAVPAELDSEDVSVRSGAVVQRSSSGRWASRLSNEITERLTADLAARDPQALVTSAPQGQTPTYRVVVTLSRFDVSAAGRVVVTADWAIVPADPAAAVQRGRTIFAVEGPVATDVQVVTLQGAAVDRLGRAIRLGPQ
jgi:uncharacterized lipoprotein YmbA